MDHDAIWKRARADLLIPIPRGEADVFLWEHSARVAKTAQTILTLPEVRVRTSDEIAVVAAALYHDAGWSARCRSGETERTEVLLGTLTEGDREEGARMMEHSLAGLLPPASLDRAGRAVRTYHERTTEVIEGHIVADAKNLQEFGLLSLWPAIRRGLLDGKAVQAVLDTWHRKQEYQFWSARLQDAFHFDSVREVARRRLADLERFMSELEQQHSVADVFPTLQTTRSAHV